jgi:GT2 family glycosyltransferase
MVVSIIIPSCKYDQLKTCLESIEKYTDLDKVEVIAVCNGMKQVSGAMIRRILPVQVLWFDEMLGYPKAVNAGIKQAKGDLIVLLNDDVELLPQAKHAWIQMLQAPFERSNKVGITGPLFGSGFLVFFCVMIARYCIRDVGMLDENFGLGAGEDTDYCIRAKELGYDLVQVPDTAPLKSSDGLCLGAFPIYHKGEGTVHDKNYVKDWIGHWNKNVDYLDLKYPGRHLGTKH